MDIIEIIEMIEETLDKAPTVPLSGKVLIDKEEILDYIQEMRLAYPDELKEAKWVKEERQRIISDAEKEAEDMIKDAQNKIVKMVDEHVITQQALQQKEDIIENANKVSKEISMGTRDYADAILEKVEEVLKESLAVVSENRKELK